MGGLETPDRLPSLREFSRCLASTFHALGDSLDPVALELTEAVPLRSRPQDPSGNLRSEPFSLLFRGPLTPLLPQRIHRLAHPELGTLEIFIVPVGPDGAGQRYEAIFN